MENVEPKRKRGRPRTYGVTQHYVFIRAMIVLDAMRRARSRSEKYLASIQLAIAAVRAKYPTMRISSTEVKRVMAEFQPRGVAKTFLSDSVDGKTMAFNLSIGTPARDRVNAKDRHGKRRTESIG